MPFFATCKARAETALAADPSFAAAVVGERLPDGLRLAANQPSMVCLPYRASAHTLEGLTH